MHVQALGWARAGWPRFFAVGLGKVMALLVGGKTNAHGEQAVRGEAQPHNRSCVRARTHE